MTAIKSTGDVSLFRRCYNKHIFSIFNAGLQHLKLQQTTDCYTKLGIFDKLSASTYALVRICERKRGFAYTFFSTDIYT